MDTKNVREQNAREWAEKDERYVWHAMSRYTPVEGGGTAPAPRMVVESPPTPKDCRILLPGT